MDAAVRDTARQVAAERDGVDVAGDDHALVATEVGARDDHVAVAVHRVRCGPRAAPARSPRPAVARHRSPTRCRTARQSARPHRRDRSRAGHAPDPSPERIAQNSLPSGSASTCQQMSSSGAAQQGRTLARSARRRPRRRRPSASGSSPSWVRAPRRTSRRRTADPARRAATAEPPSGPGDGVGTEHTGPPRCDLGVDAVNDQRGRLALRAGVEDAELVALGVDRARCHVPAAASGSRSTVAPRATQRASNGAPGRGAPGSSRSSARAPR